MKQDGKTCFQSRHLTNLRFMVGRVLLCSLDLPLVSGEEERLPVLSLYTLGLKGAFKVGRVVLGLSLSFRATKTEQKAARSPMGTPWPVPAWECLTG